MSINTNVIDLTFQKMPNQSTLLELSSHPNSADCCNIIISSIEHSGHSTVVSLYGDITWDFGPFIPNANWNTKKKIVDWSTFPSSFIPSAKSVVFAYWSTAIDGRKRPKATTVIGFVNCLRAFVRWLAANNVTQFVDVRPLHCKTYAQELLNKGLRPKGRLHLLATIELIYSLRDKTSDPMPEHPWQESSASALCGLTGKGAIHDPVTEIIPRAILQILFAQAEATLDQADTILNDITCQANKHHHRNKAMIRLRNACYFLLALTTGCRNHELASIEVGAAVTTIHDEETYHWLKGVSLKTDAGATEWMMPEIGVRAVHVMERWSQRLREKINFELSIMQSKFATLEQNEKSVPELKKYEQLKIDRDRLFLGYTPMTGEITTLSGHSWNRQLKIFATECGVNWPLATHQLRRTFAAMAAHHALGDLRYLKHHFKHWSMDMSALYALNRAQEEDLFDEVLTSIRERKASIVLNLLDPNTLLAGTAANHIREYRKTIEITKLERRALIEDTAEKVSIRGTGHSWCLATSPSCGGRGLYEKTYCAGSGCKNAVIPDYFEPVYRGLHQQMLELSAFAEELGPGGRERVKRDLQVCEKILQEFGVDTKKRSEQ